MEVRPGDGSVITCEVVGERGAAPVLVCHGLADSRLSAHLFTQAAGELGLRVVAPDRPGVGGSDLGNRSPWGWPGRLPHSVAVSWPSRRAGAPLTTAFLRLVTSELPAVDRRALAQPGMRDSFVAGRVEAFRRGSWGVAQDLRVLTRPWGFQLGSIQAEASIHHGDADTTVPPTHAHLFAEAIPGARLHIHPGHGHFSILGAARQMLAPLAR